MALFIFRDRQMHFSLFQVVSSYQDVLPSIVVSSRHSPQDPAKGYRLESKVTGFFCWKTRCSESRVSGDEMG